MVGSAEDSEPSLIVLTTLSPSHFEATLKQPMQHLASHQETSLCVESLGSKQGHIVVGR